MNDCSDENVLRSEILPTELTDRLAQLVEHRTTVREVAGSNLNRTNTQGLQMNEEKVLPS